MAEPSDQHVIQLDDGESNRLHAVWSRSGKHLIVTIAPHGEWHRAGQVELSHEQVESLHAFLAQRAQSV